MKKISAILGIVILTTCLMFGCSKQEIPTAGDIQSIDVHIGGQGQEENTYFSVSDKQNIEEILSINKELNNYKPNDIDTWKLNVELTYKLKDGKEVEKFFRGIRPVDDYFEKIYDSLEYKMQVLPIFNIELEEIDQVEFESSFKDYEWITDDKEIIKQAYENAKEYYKNESNYNEETSGSNGRVTFYMKGNKIASTVILREEKIWDDMFEKYPEISKIKILPEDVKEVELETENGKKYIISDKETIQKVLDTYVDGWMTKSKISVDIKLNNGKRKTIYGSYYEHRIPEFIEDLIDSDNRE